MSFLVNEDGIDREPTPQELAELIARQTDLADQAAAAEQAAADDAAAAASGRTKLAALGLTNDEIDALLGA
jgi:hypothetical protein